MSGQDGRMQVETTENLTNKIIKADEDKREVHTVEY